MDHPKLDSLNKLLTLLANVGVLFGLFFLIYEISQNTIAIENESAWARMGQTIELNNPLMTDYDRYEQILENQSMSLAEIEHLQESNPALYGGQSIAASTRRAFFQTQYMTQISPEWRSALEEEIHGFLRGNNLMRYMISNSRDSTLHPEFAIFLRDIIDELDSEFPIL